MSSTEKSINALQEMKTRLGEGKEGRHPKAKSVAKTVRDDLPGAPDFEDEGEIEETSREIAKSIYDIAKHQAEPKASKDEIKKLANDALDLLDSDLGDDAAPRVRDALRKLTK